MKTLQEYADEKLVSAGLPQYVQPLKSLPEAFAAHGWGSARVPSDENKGVSVHSVGPVAVEFYEPATGKFAMDVTGPFVDTGLAPEDVADAEFVDVAGEPGIRAQRSFIVGVRAVNARTAAEDAVKNTLQSDATVKKFQDAATNAMVKGLLDRIAGGLDDDGITDAGTQRVLH